MITTYIAKRRLKVGPDLWIEPRDEKRGVVGNKGHLCPQVVLWPRWESFLHTGYVGEIQVTELEFEEALDNAVPKLSKLDKIRIREHHGRGDAYGLHGPHKMPFTRSKVIQEADAERAARAGTITDAAVLEGPVPNAKAPLPAKRAPRARQIAVQKTKPIKRAPRVRPVKASPAEK